jgi:hypothetical protein
MAILRRSTGMAIEVWFAENRDGLDCNAAILRMTRRTQRPVKSAYVICSGYSPSLPKYDGGEAIAGDSS